MLNMCLSSIPTELHLRVFSQSPCLHACASVNLRSSEGQRGGESASFLVYSLPFYLARCLFFFLPLRPQGFHRDFISFARLVAHTRLARRLEKCTQIQHGGGGGVLSQQLSEIASPLLTSRTFGTELRWKGGEEGTRPLEVGKNLVWKFR